MVLEIEMHHTTHSYCRRDLYVALQSYIIIYVIRSTCITHIGVIRPMCFTIKRHSFITIGVIHPICITIERHYHTSSIIFVGHVTIGVIRSICITIEHHYHTSL